MDLGEMHTSPDNAQLGRSYCEWNDLSPLLVSFDYGNVECRRNQLFAASWNAKYDELSSSRTARSSFNPLSMIQWLRENYIQPSIIWPTDCLSELVTRSALVLVVFRYAMTKMNLRTTSSIHQHFLMIILLILGILQHRIT